jgi:hypothetical protein
MKMAHACFVAAGLSALSAASLSLAQTFQNQMCFGTPVPVCKNQCGCPISTSPFDFCLGAIPPQGATEITFYYCTSFSGFTCTSPDPGSYCGGKVVDCVIVNQNNTVTPCGCCGYGAVPSCNGDCGWWCPDPCIVTDKPDACFQYYGCTMP